MVLDAVSGGQIPVESQLAAAERVHRDPGAVAFREGQADYGRPFGRCNLDLDVVVGEIDAVVVGPCHFAFVREPAGVLPAVISGKRHNGEGAVVVDPGRRLVGLLEAGYPVGAVLVGPSVILAPGRHRGPEIHAPGQSYCRIGVTRGKRPVGLRPDKRGHIVRQVLFRSFPAAAGKKAYGQNDGRPFHTCSHCLLRFDSRFTNCGPMFH